jgi:hypothetical protein
MRGRRDGISSEAQFLAPSDLAFGPNGDLFVLDNGTTIRRIATNQVVSTLLVSGSFGTPLTIDSVERGFIITVAGNLGGIAVDASGKIYVADQYDNTIKVAEPAVGSVSMKVTRVESGIQLALPTEAGLVLETTTDMSDPNSWHKIRTTTNNLDRPKRFYRLHAP